MDDRKTLYRLLNDADPAPEGLTPTPLTEDERNALAQALPRARRRRWPKGVAAVAAAALLMLAFSFTQAGQQAYATAKSALDEVQYNLADAFGIGPEFVPYADLKGTAQPLGEASVKLNGVIVNGDEVILNTFIQVPGKGSPRAFLHVAHETLQVNGKPVEIFGSGGSLACIDAEKNIWEETVSYYLKTPLPMNEPLHLSYLVQKLVYEPDRSQKITYRGQAAFHFTANSEELAKNIRDVAQNIVIPTYDGGEVKLVHLYLSPVAPRAYLKGPESKDGAHAVYALRGQDDAGHQVAFSARTSTGAGDHRLVYDEPMADDYGHYGSTLSSSDFTKQSKRVTLTLYRQWLPKESGPEEAYEAISEPFSIDL